MIKDLLFNKTLTLLSLIASYRMQVIHRVPYTYRGAALAGVWATTTTASSSYSLSSGYACPSGTSSYGKGLGWGGNEAKKGKLGPMVQTRSLFGLPLFEKGAALSEDDRFCLDRVRYEA